jgi:CheY-like chemotaxis protein
MVDKSATAKHVLVVDDEPDFAALLASILIKAGYAVTTAYNGEDAFSQIRNGRPDIVTLDIQMPRQSGAMFYRKLKADVKLRDIPVVVVTGITRDDNDMATLVRSLLEPDNVPHPDAYVEKPVGGPSFLNTIQGVLLATATNRGR